jgi:hypothetical protein
MTNISQEGNVKIIAIYPPIRILLLIKVHFK